MFLPTLFRKQKWDEDDFEGEMEEDYDDDMPEEGLQMGLESAAPGRGIMLLSHRQLHPQFKLQKARPGLESEPRVSGLPTPPSHSQQLSQDHTDWTYEEQFRQVGLHRDNFQILQGCPIYLSRSTGQSYSFL